MTTIIFPLLDVLLSISLMTIPLVPLVLLADLTNTLPVNIPWVRQVRQVLHMARTSNIHLGLHHHNMRRRPVSYLRLPHMGFRVRLPGIIRVSIAYLSVILRLSFNHIHRSILILHNTEMIEIATSAVGITSVVMKIGIQMKLGILKTRGTVHRHQMANRIEMNTVMTGMASPHTEMIDILVGGDMVNLKTSGVGSVKIAKTGFSLLRIQTSGTGITDESTSQQRLRANQRAAIGAL
ncbi:hypothetical protein GL218_01997 [Daldinia childiae]|uniref:uncharacterized protein n=1 Tax=Daldinia childiae TaxID=326645 RepID=UPI0014475827|nr:uncharacterized protein GL218_01997 [Daldinia childiae]KAF3064076.1 hypothetical protein GL218_01997 [Daldinia childiae]